MMTSHAPISSRRVCIACGGTGGHLFPGLAVATELRRMGAQVCLIVSEKEVDQMGLHGEDRFEVLRLPAAGLGQSGRWSVLRGFLRSLSICRAEFSAHRPDAVLSMGGFTSAPPMIAGRWAGASLFLHDSNAVAGRVNRWLSGWATEAFVAFPPAAGGLRSRSITCSGTPIREAFRRPESPAASRVALGLDPLRPVLLITGGSQGARGVNDAVLSLFPHLGQVCPDLQILHLTGTPDFDSVVKRYEALKVQARVLPFLPNMELALGAATLVISRAGGSSVAEMAAMGCACILIPYPTAADDHQRRNAAWLVERGAALCLEQEDAKAGKLFQEVVRLIRSDSVREAMSGNVLKLHAKDAAHTIALRLVENVAVRANNPRAAALAAR